MEAKGKGVAIIPNCGVGPGLSNIIAVSGAEIFDADSVRVFLGGIPAEKK